MSILTTNLIELAERVEGLHRKATTGPWKADVIENTGENWLIGTGYCDRDKVGDWIVSTDDVPCSEHNGADAQDDAEAIAEMRNLLPEIAAALRARAQGVSS